MKTFDDYLEAVQDDEFAGWSRETLINLCAHNDPNGVYTDEDSESEGYNPLTKEQLVDIIKKDMQENGYESFAEWRKAASGSMSTR